jgi:subtilase family serine protease
MHSTARAISLRFASLALAAWLALASAGAHAAPALRAVQAAAHAAPALRAVQAPPHAVAGATDAGSAPADAALQLSVVLRPRDPQGLAAFASAVATPGSPSFHRYLGRGAFAQRFGAAPATVAAVRRALRDAGLAPAAAPVDGLLLPVSGTVAQVEAALHTPLRAYRLRDGHRAIANAAAPLLPAAVAGDVASIVGLDTRARLRPAGLDTHATSHGVTGCAGAASLAATESGYTADQLAHAYGFDTLPGLGAGVTVAIFSLEPYAPSDVAQYQSCYGTSASVTSTDVDGGAGSGAGEGEAALDVETVIGLAPQASVRVYQGPNGGAGVLDLWSRIAADDSAKVVSTSWGLCEQDLGAAEAAAEAIVFQQLASQGQTVLAASGDAGSEDCGGSDTQLAVHDPASQAYVTGVGGTDLAPGGETVWNDAYGGSGGGISTLTAMPSWQSAPGVVSGSSSAAPCHAVSGWCRQVPDVSASASPAHPYMVYWSGAWQGVGGTSAAAPLWAALVAVLDGSGGCATPVGFLNPTLYQLATAGTADFTDVTSGDNDVLGLYGGAFSATAGYDMASGLGTPLAAHLGHDLCNVTPVTVPPPSPPHVPPVPTGGGSGSSTPPSAAGPAAPTTGTATPPAPPSWTGHATLGRLPRNGLRLIGRDLLDLPFACSGGRCLVTLRVTTPAGRLLGTLRGARLARGTHGWLVVRLSPARLATLEQRHPRRVRLRLGMHGARTVTLVLRLPARR